MTDRSEYAGILTKVPPGQAVEILYERVRQAGRLNTAISEWLQERCRLEEQYAASLRRLARKNVDDVDLGIFSVPWSSITGSMDSTADAHSSLAHKIETDVERALRDFPQSSREMAAMTSMQGNLAALAKDIERAQQKADKLQGRGERAEAGKVASAVSDLDTARARWDSQAPYVFESLQTLDETRTAQLRDQLTQLQTLELDQVEKSRAAAEQSLNILLNVETRDEIKTFALKAASQSPAPPPPPASRYKRESFVPGVGTLPAAAPSSAAPVRSGSSSNALATIPSSPDASAGQFSAANTPEPAKKSALKGLKRIGTVMSRRSSKQPAINLPSTTEVAERKPKSSPFGRLGRNKDSYSDNLDLPQDGNPVQRPASPHRVGSEVLEPPVSRQTSTTASGAPQLDPVPQMNGSSSLMPSGGAVFPNGSHQGDFVDLDPPKPVQPEESAPATPPVTEPQRDIHGYSVPPPNLDPISQAEAEADATAFGERSEPQFNVNIRNAPIREEGADLALANMATKLQAPPPASQRRAGTIRGRRDNRNSAILNSHGSSDQVFPEPATVAAPAPVERSMDTIPASPVQYYSAPTMQQPSELSTGSVVQSPPVAISSFTAGAAAAFAPFSTSTEPASPIRPTSRTANIAQDYTGDSQSVRSGRSLQSTASQGTRHPELHEPGLSSSIVETVSAKFENGKPVSSTLIGEVALAFNPADVSSSFGHENIRLENFATLDRVAPNPAFITTIPDKEYEYTVNLGSITRTQIAFKYQILHDNETNTHMPLLITPAFKIQDKQAMAIVSYSLAPTFMMHGKDSITLSNVMIALTLDHGKATTCQSKPTGTFNREKSLIFWQLGDVTLQSGAEPEKLLARFSTENEATGGSVEAKWELSGESARGLGSPLSISMTGQPAGDGADPFADEGAAPSAWKTVPLLKKVAAGSYVAK